jgi:hypothetical protein
MKHTKKYIKLDVHNQKSRPARKKGGQTDAPNDSPDCSGNAVTYCNQWGCHSRSLCHSDEEGPKTSALTED